MKPINATIEIILMAITLFVGLAALTSEENHLLGMAWLAVLGFCQAIHSIILGFSYWDIKKIKIALLIYWGVTIFTVITIPVENLISNYTTAFDAFRLLALPLSLAFYILWITFFFTHRK